METCDPKIEALLKETIVRVFVGDEQEGTGFFVASDAVVTCKHVLEALDLASRAALGLIGVTAHRGREFVVESVRHVSNEADLVVLRVAPSRTARYGADPPPEPGCALLEPGARRGDELQAYGYTEVHPEGIPATFEVEGYTGDEKLFKFKEGRVEHMMSGAPVLNLRTGAVCGVLRRTIDPDDAAAGGYAIPLLALFALSDSIKTDNRRHHEGHRDWLELLPAPTQVTWQAVQRDEQKTGPADLMIIVSVEQGQDFWEVTGHVRKAGAAAPHLEIGPVPVNLNTVRVEVARLFRDWASPDLTWRGRVNRGEEARLLGKVLRTAVLPGELGEYVEELIAEQDHDRWVQLALRFTKKAAPDLAYLPWEHLYFEADAEEARGESYLAHEKGFASREPTARSRGPTTRRQHGRSPSCSYTRSPRATPMRRTI